MNNKIVGIGVVTGMLGLAIGFFGGAAYAGRDAAADGPWGNFANMTQAEREAMRGQFTGTQPGGVRFNRQNGAQGEIISSAADSIVIKLESGGSQNVYFSSTTGILNTASGTPEDLVAGKKVMVNGMPNTDGSITARVITIRP